MNLKLGQQLLESISPWIWYPALDPIS